RIVLCAWRLRRACRAEAGLVAAAVRVYAKYGETASDGVLVHDIAKITTLGRYETATERALHRSLTLLEQRQARRRERED
ncbi:MAG TPA: hypothetical protein VET85_01805, partial [Stellaceae bacterium]|nr:hypothetical protein [Stellaceae bacterium]